MRDDGSYNFVLWFFGNQLSRILKKPIKGIKLDLFYMTADWILFHFISTLWRHYVFTLNCNFTNFYFSTFLNFLDVGLFCVNSISLSLSDVFCIIYMCIYNYLRLHTLRNKEHFQWKKNFTGTKIKFPKWIQSSAKDL